MRRKQKCRDSASGLPGGLSIESFITVADGDCTVRADAQAVHVVQIQNRSLLRFSVGILAQCESESISYPADERSWERNVHVGDRPDKGGAYTRKVTEDLTCAKTSVDESITVSVKYEAIGCRCFGSAQIDLLVDTRR